MSTAGRHDWVKADLRCLLGGRTLGGLFGPAERAARLSGLSRFSAVRANVAGAPVTQLTGTEHFKCPTCGGAGLIGEIETFSTYDDDFEDETPEPHRRGRRPKPWRRLPDTRLTELGLATT